METKGGTVLGAGIFNRERRQGILRKEVALYGYC